MARGYTASEGQLKQGATSFAAAYKMSEAAHEGQFRRDGKTPYFNHVKQVVSGVSGWKAKTVALLHDTVEDKRLSYDDLRDAGLPNDVIEGVRAMTKPDGMPYLDYIKNIVLPNELARQVKLADMKANLADKPTERQVKKYEEAMKLFKDLG
jgi:(p)ppGpp synthase/HD superfamily hydrolase